MARSALVIISKIRVENLPIRDVQGTDVIKIKFRCGQGAATETPALRPNRDGTAEWTVPLEMALPDVDNMLVAVVSRKNASSNKWTMMTDGRFEGPVVSTLPALSEWRVPSTARIRFFAILEVLMDEEEGVQQQAALQGATMTEDARPPPSVPLDDAESNSRWYDATSGSSAGYVDAWGGGREGGGGEGPMPSALAPTEAAETATAHHAVATADIGFGRFGTVGARAAPGAVPPMARSGSFPFPTSGFLMTGNSQDGDVRLRRGSSRRSSRSFTSERSSFRSDEATGDVQGGQESPSRGLPSPEGSFTRSSIYDPDAPLKEVEEDDGYAAPEGRFLRSRLLDESGLLDEDGDSSWGRAVFAGKKTPVKAPKQGEEEQRDEVKAEGRREVGSEGASLAQPVAAAIPLKKGFFEGLLPWRNYGGRRPQRGRHFARVSFGHQEITTGTDGSQPQLQPLPQPQPQVDTVTRGEQATDRLGLEILGSTVTLSSFDADPMPPSPPIVLNMHHPRARPSSRRLSAVPAAEESPKSTASSQAGAVSKPASRSASPSPVSSPVGQSDSAAPGFLDSISHSLARPHTSMQRKHSSLMRRGTLVSLYGHPLSTTRGRPPSPPPLPALGAPPPPTNLRTDSGRLWLPGRVISRVRGPRPPPPPRPTPGALLPGRPPPTTGPRMEVERLPPAMATGSSSSVEEEEEEEEEECGDLGGFETSPGPSYVSAGALGISWVSEVGDEKSPTRQSKASWSKVERPAPAGGGPIKQQLKVVLSNRRRTDEARYSTMPENSLSNPEIHPPRALLSPRQHGSKSLVAPVGGREDPGPVLLNPTPSTSIPVDAGAHGERTRAMQPLPPPRNWNSSGVAGADPVCFSCFSPPEVSEGTAFMLRVSAYLRQQRDDVLREATLMGVGEAGVPGAMPIMRGARVTVKLDLPNDVFEVMQPDNQESIGAARPPSIQEFEWTGEIAKADFKVGVRRGAMAGSVLCAAQIIEGSTMTRVSFRIEVVEPGMVLGGMGAKEMKTNVDQMQTDVAKIDHEELQFGRKLGEGVQGVTFAGRWKGKAVAIKQLKEAPASPLGTTGRSDIEHEATILSLLGSHPNIVEFYGLSRSNGDTFSVVTKLEKGGSLEDVLGRNGQNGREPLNGTSGQFGMDQYSGPVRTAWARDLARGLAKSHTFGVVHNDVACRNALLSRNGSTGRALLCDFGLSSSLRGGTAELEAACMIDVDDTGVKWPLKQMPREALEAPFALSPLSDSYMFGVTLYELYSGEKPFAGISSRQAVKLVLEGKLLDPPELLVSQGRTLLNVFNNCLSPDLSIRPSMEKVVHMLSTYGRGGSSS